MFLVKVLDSRDLSIKSVTVQATGQVLEHTLGTPIGTFGCSLTVQLPVDVPEGYVWRMLVYYIHCLVEKISSEFIYYLGIYG